MARNTSFGRDTGLQVRMTLTMFLLGAVYVVLIGALLAAGAGGVTIAVIAGGLFLLQIFTSDKLALHAMGAREVTPQQAPGAARDGRAPLRAGRPAQAAGRGRPDRRCPTPSRSGARPRNATVCATTGIMELLSPGRARGRDGARAHPRRRTAT